MQVSYFHALWDQEIERDDDIVDPEEDYCENKGNVSVELFSKRAGDAGCKGNANV